MSQTNISISEIANDPIMSVTWSTTGIGKGIGTGLVPIPSNTATAYPSAATNLEWRSPLAPPDPPWFFSLRRDPYVAVELADGRFWVYKKKPYWPIYLPHSSGVSREVATQLMEKFTEGTVIKQVYTLEDLHAARALDALTKEA